jgi:predicted DsbA family dithiol-disulfide isomerase
MMKVEIWSDIACPWCFIGKRRFARAMGSFSHRDDVEIVWRSFELDPAAPKQHGVPQAELLASKYGVSIEQATSMDANMTAEGRKEGLDMRFDRVQVGNTFDAHRLIHFANTHGRGAEMVERLFAAYFTDGAAIADTDVLVRLATEVGLDADAARGMLQGTAFADAVRADEARAQGFGISAVPFFAIDERYGISGAQPPEVMLDALRQAWDDASSRTADAVPASATSATSASGAGCEDGSCAV